jgi:hypothetical protein
MPRAAKVCPTPGCPTIIAAGQRYCTDCARAYEQRRGTRQQRGYDAQHDAMRRRLAPLVATGTVRCWRCRELITRDEPWDLGHTDDRTAYAGAEHTDCNRSAGGKAAHGA